MSGTPLVTYALAESIATLTMDDGKANVMTMEMLDALSAALDRAESDRAVVLLRGRARFFSAGYDLAMFHQPQDEIARTLRTGGEIVERILSFPLPVVAACSGHAIAQGAFVLLAADARIGAVGDFKIGLNEVAIGLTIPHYGIEAARQRLTPAWFNHATATGALYPPPAALVAGFFDHLVEAENLEKAALVEARRLRGLDMAAHAATKLRTRAPALDAIRRGIESEFPTGAPDGTGAEWALS